MCVPCPVQISNAKLDKWGQLHGASRIIVATGKCQADVDAIAHGQMFWKKAAQRHGASRIVATGGCPKHTCNVQLRISRGCCLVGGAVELELVLHSCARRCPLLHCICSPPPCFIAKSSM